MLHASISHTQTLGDSSLFWGLWIYLGFIHQDFQYQRDYTYYQFASNKFRLSSTAKTITYHNFVWHNRGGWLWLLWRAACSNLGTSSISPEGVLEQMISLVIGLLTETPTLAAAATPPLYKAARLLKLVPWIVDAKNWFNHSNKKHICT